MNLSLKAASLVLSAVLLIATGIWRYLVAGGLRPAHSAVILDPSKSSRNSCDCVATLAERALASPGVTIGSTISLFITGDAATANEPILIAKYQVPQQRAVLEGGNAERRRKEKLLNDLKAQCKKIVPSNRSPIFFSVQRGVEHLRSLGCDEKSNCQLYMITDGEELIHPGIKQAISGQLSKRNAALPNPIRNEGIQITFCGFAETSGLQNNAGGKGRRLTPDRDPERADRLRKVWMSLFTVPALLGFEPFCSDVKEQNPTPLQ